MRSKLSWVLAVLFVAAACNREAPVNYKQPPAGSYTIGTHQVKIGDSLVRLDGASVTPEFFTAVGVQPLLGRFFAEGEQGPQAGRVVVLSHDLWRERFDASPAIIGRTLDVDGHPTTVVGIAPRGFTLPGATLIWTPKNSDVSTSSSAGVSTRTEVCRAVTEPEIRALFDRWNGSLKTGDPHKVVANYAERSILLPTLSNTPRLTTAEKEDYFEHFLAKKPVGRIDSGTIEVGCNTAVDAGLYTFTFGTSDPPVKARYTYTYKWDGTQWLITSHHSSAMPEKQ